MNILFVEDERDLKEIGTMQLEGLGHKVLQAKNIQEANSAYAENEGSIDLIISDHRLPDGDGLNFALKVRAKTPEIELAIVSGYLKPHEKRVLDNEKIAHFAKPLLYSTVVKTMEQLDSSEENEEAEISNSDHFKDPGEIPVKRSAKKSKARSFLELLSKKVDKTQLRI